MFRGPSYHFHDVFIGQLLSTEIQEIFEMHPINIILGLETGERNVVCHVIRLNEITFEFQSALNPGNKEFGTFLERHGDAVKDIAFNCTDVDALILKVGGTNLVLFI